MKKIAIYIIMCITFMLVSCSTTSNLPEGEVLYTGMKKINYEDPGSGETFITLQEEVEAALACAPNGALLGSSYYRTPFPIKLWIYNKYGNSESKFGKWMANSFGSEPVLMSNVNPEVRALVAKNLLRNNGYFNAKVTPVTIPGKNPKKAKISYDITLGHLYTLDTMEYVGYPSVQDSMIMATTDSRRIGRGDAFSVSALDAERTRLSNMFRNNGFYYYRPEYSMFVADSVSNPGQVEVHLQPAGNIPHDADKQWTLGRLRVNMRKSVTEPLTDSIQHRMLTVYYNGRKPPIRPRTLLRDIKLRPNQLYSQSKYTESINNVNGMGLFTLGDFTFTPRDTTTTSGILDMTLNCIFDKQYDASFEANYSIKSSDRTGPGIVLGLTKRNAFRGGEKLSLNLKGSYEWQTGRNIGGSSSRINSYEYGADLSLEYPRIEAPFKLYNRHRFYSSPSTMFSLSTNVLNRAKYFKMLTTTVAVTYKFQTSALSRHELSPLLIDFNKLQHTTATFDSIAADNPVIYMSMRDQFVPKMKYTYTYTSPQYYKNPIMWETSVTEAGNLLSLAYAAAGKSLGEEGKDLFGNPFAQFIKVQSTLKKTWLMGVKSQLVGRLQAGVIWSYGNSSVAPYSEQFYVGGANSIRAFTVRSIGPGKYVAPNSIYSYLDQTGDVKFEANLEYRFNLFGSLYGATFLDVGNVWLLRNDEVRPSSQFKVGSFFKELATGTGVGIRYDMDFLVIRLDLGIALHVPYDTGKGGYYNIPDFKDGLGLHFAIGYPF